MNEMLTVAAVADLLNVLPAYVVKKIRGGKLPASENADARYTVACSDAEAYRLKQNGVVARRSKN